MKTVREAVALFFSPLAGLTHTKCVKTEQEAIMKMIEGEIELWGEDFLSHNGDTYPIIYVRNWLQRRMRSGKEDRQTTSESVLPQPKSSRSEEEEDQTSG